MASVSDLDPRYEQIAKGAAMLFRSQLAPSLPTIVQLMTIDMLAKTIFMTDVKPERRLELLDQWLDGIRKYVVDESKPKKQPRKPNGKS